MDSFPLCTETWNLLPMFRGLGEDGVSLTRKAKGYSFFLPCSDFASVYGARGGEVGGDIQTVRAVLTGWWSGMAPPTGRRCSITIAESHLGYLGPDHQAVSGPIWGCPGGSAVKSLPASAGDTGSIPGSRSPGEGNGNPLQYSLPGKSCGHPATPAAPAPPGAGGAGYSLVGVSGSYSLVVVHSFLIAVASLGAEHRL